MSRDIAVITDGALIKPSGYLDYITDGITHVSDVARIGLAPVNGLRAVWIDPMSQIAVRAADPAFWGPRDGWRFLATGPRNQTPVTARIHEDVRGRHDAELFVYASFDKTWRGDVSDDPRAMLASIMAYEKAIGEAEWSPARTMLNSLQRANDSDKRRAWLASLDGESLYTIPWPDHRAPAHVSPLIQTAPYLHVFDVSGAYLAACSRTFGTGAPILVDGSEYDDHSYGLWQVSAKIAEAPLSLPNPWSAAHGRVVNREWFYAPHIEIARKMGWKVTVHQGYKWHAQHVVMTPWNTDLWKAREAARERGDSTAVALIKASYTRGCGMLGMIPLAREAPKWFMRPDWAGYIVAESYARRLGTIKILSDLYPGAYVALSTDAIALLSNEADPWQAFPYLAERRGRIGSYKHVATLHGPADIIMAAGRGMIAPDLFALIGQQSKGQHDAN